MRRRLILAGALWASGCTTRVGKDGQRDVVVDAKYLAKTEIDRVADGIRNEVEDGLMHLADKLYRRNPSAWQAGLATDREAALSRLRQRQMPEPLAGRREGAAALAAFSEDYPGDRVAALLFGLLTMVDAAFEYKREFFLLDELNEKKLFNCARNMEIAVWKLNSARNGAGAPFLLANALDAAQPNLSFEREFGRIMGLLDFLAKTVADRNGRTLSRVGQSMATAVFLPVGLLR